MSGAVPLHPLLPSWHDQGKLSLYGDAGKSCKYCVFFGYLTTVLKQLHLECLLPCSAFNYVTLRREGCLTVTGL